MSERHATTRKTRAINNRKGGERGEQLARSDVRTLLLNLLDTVTHFENEEHEEKK